MGVDITTYRSRIGRFNPGTDSGEIAMLLNLTKLCKTVGCVVCIGMLLLIAGIEPNPGPRTRYGSINTRSRNESKRIKERKIDGPPAKKVKRNKSEESNSLPTSPTPSTSMLTTPSPSVFDGSTLDEDLMTCGIDPDNWIGSLPQHTSVSAFNMTGIGFPDRHSNSRLDKNQKIAAEKYQNFRKLQLSNVLENQKEAKRILNELEELRNEGHDRSSNIVEQKEHSLRTVLNVPESKWLRSSDGETLDTMVERFQSQFGELDEMLAKEKNVPELTLLETASNGLALKGTLVSKDFKHSTDIKQQIIKVPTDVVFHPPVLTEIEEVIELSSETVSDLFQRSLSSVGHTTARKISIQAPRITEETIDKFCSKIIYSLIPTASCEIKLKSLRLTDAVLCDLQKIESLQRSCSNRDAVQNECERFFRAYGSHVNCGMVHFGGIYEWISVYNNPTCKTKEAVLPMLEDALNTFASLSCSSFAFNVGNGLSGEQVENQAVFSASHDSSELSKTNLRVLKFGGATDINTLSLWRFSVVERNSTWAVIDRGDIESDFKGVWDVVLNHASDFKNGQQLSDLLQKSWQKFISSDRIDNVLNQTEPEIQIKLNDIQDVLKSCQQSGRNQFEGVKYAQSTDFISSDGTSPEYSVADKILSGLDTNIRSPTLHNEGEKIVQTRERLENIFLRLNYWLNDPDLRNTCLSYLENLVEEVKQVSVETGNFEFWINAIQTNKTVSDFIVKIIDLKSSFKDVSDFPFIRKCFKWLLDPLGENDFYQKTKIISWTFNKKCDKLPNILTSKDYNSVGQLISAMKDQFMPEVKLYCTSNSTATSVQRTERFITGQLALVSDKLLTKLESSSHVYQYVLLKILLTKLSYNSRIRGFETLLTVAKADEFTAESVKQVDAYKHYEMENMDGLQAFLVHLAATYTQTAEHVEKKEEYFKDLIAKMKRRLSKPIKKSISKYATHSPFNWLPLLVDMTKLMEDDKHHSQPSNEYRASDNIVAPETPDTDYTTLSEGENELPVRYEHGREILSSLALEEYFPGKITLQDVMAVRKETDMHNATMSEVPWIVLKKVIMLDYRARDAVLANLGTKHESASTSDVSIDDIMAELGRDDCDNQCLHPHDVFLATFNCCDPMLKQILVSKMFICKLAVPFIYSLLSTEHLYLSLWPLRTITIINNGSETPITKHSSKHVTFIRLKNPPCSKSKLMNDIINDSSHDTYFTIDNFPKKSKRVISSGLTEVSWFLPSEKSKETGNFQDLVTFINLRGDALNHETQLKFLRKMTDIFVVVIDVANLIDGSCSKFICDLYKNSTSECGASVIILLTNKTSHNVKKMLESFLNHISPDEKRRTKFISTERLGSLRNTADIKRDVRKSLIGILEGYPGNSLESWGMLTQETGILNDEFVENCLSGKELAENVLLPLAEDRMNKVLIKKKMAPLQGELWGTFTELLKEQMKVGQNSTIYEKDEFQRQMSEVRQKQVEICKHLSPLMGLFISTLIEKVNNKELLLYFLQWLKLDLDEKSRSVIPGLYKNYNTARANYKSSKGRDVSESALATLRLKVDQAERDLSDASFGLEHLFREVGQIYEALVDRNTKLTPDTRQLAEQLPHAVAKLLTYGHPFELMDGDTANIPLTWVYAVMKHLKQIIGEKKLFCLSVLGIQSSGKSTLLNTMFGLQFAVSAGRCTRGIFMQLVPVHKSETGFSYDYVLVIDTEGLRAPELAQQKFDHDNKLATLVIGMGDITIINLKGETTAEVEDVLQIAVHAFLRLKMVYQNLQLRQSCVFVHQNVPAQNANDKMACGRQKFLDDLDVKTEEAAQQENIRDIHAFNQVIEFDDSQHVWYFSDLWHGDPPMAPANPGYSKRVAEVKQCILEKLASKGNGFLDVTDTMLHLEDLWRGILKDNFVFSFRNSLEVRAYNRMESVYQELLWKLEEVVFEGVQKKAANALLRCTSSDELFDYKSKSKNTLSEEILRETEKIKNNLEDFFKNDNLRHILVKWKQTKFLSLRESSEYLICKARQEIDEMEQQQRVDLLKRTKQIQHETEINNIASQLADSLKGQKPTDQELDNKFNEVWVQWMNQLVSRAPAKDECVEKLVKKKVFDRLHDQNHSLSEEIAMHPLECAPNITCLEGSVTKKDIKNEYISLKRSYRDTERHRSLENCKKHTVQVTDVIMRKLDVIINDLEKTDTKFKEAHLSKILNTLVQGLEKHNENADVHQFALLPPYKAKLAIHVCRYAIGKFKIMNEKYEKKHSTKAKLEEYRETAYKLFKNIVGQKTEEVIAATFFSERMYALVISTVLTGLTVKVQNYILSDFAHTKFHLMVTILDDLACKDNFDNYRSYIDDPYTYAHRWITEYTNEKMFTRRGVSGSRFGELAKGHISKIITCVQKGISDATQNVEGVKGIKIARWIGLFEEHVRKEVVLHIGAFKHVTDRTVHDFPHFKRLLLAHLHEIEKKSSNYFEMQNASTVTWTGRTPYRKAIERLWGCDAICPFCHEPCQKTDKRHIHSGECHTCIQHRPLGVRGTHKDGQPPKDSLIVESCNYKVQTDTFFKCSVCHFRCRESGNCSATKKDEIPHKYLHYKTFLPEWDIAPSANMESSDYWKWFMCTYQKELQETFGVSLSDIPDSWKSIDKKAALDSLRIAYNY